MTSARFLWVVVAGREHSSEQRAALTEDLGDAKAKVNGYTGRLRQQGPDRLVRRRLGPRPADRYRAARKHPPNIGWERVYFVDGRD